MGDLEGKVPCRKCAAFKLRTVRPALTRLDAVLGDILHPLQHPMLRLSRLPQLQVQQLSQILRLLPLANLPEEKLRSGTHQRLRRSQAFSFSDLTADVCALAKDLLHNDLKGLAQEELPLSVINQRFPQVAKAGRSCWSIQ